MLEQYVKKILTSRVYDVAVETPLQTARQLSERLGNTVLLKREDLQPVFSFKIRGAYNKLTQLTAEERARGVVTASAGNHAQGLALAAKVLGVKATIVMPKTTPEIKVEGVRSRGGKVVLHGDSFPEALAYSLKLVDEKGYVYIHPYDDPHTIAGQGTVAMEILRQHQGPLDAIFVPVGGGGLIAGIAAYVKYLRPEIKIIGVEPDDSNCLQAAMAAGERVVLPTVGIFADGVAVAQIGQYTFDICKDYVDEVITVSTDEICAAIKDIYDDTRSITEPAGALGVAGIKKYVETRNVTGQTLVAIDSGANVNFDRLRHVAERAELGEGREAIIAVTIPEKPGSFKAFCEAVGKRQITEFNYRYHTGREAHIFVGVQTHPENDPRSALIASLTGKGFPVLDLTENELAKLHIRHMVGGHAAKVSDEVVFRFEFPERPGALFNFLNKLGGRWNISMFHYRNHGAADGRVVAGLQVPADERHLVSAALEAIGYPYWDESDNPAYKLFLG
ncbi:threonine ammonia-lyase, biosynthetic [Pseudomonas extremaustralis]|jgi:threonine dehydratase|uniref:L-threonine dehydratase n=1 Tax=Pseudomonas extremaustralis TaxID=359110 RepID=A0A5C5QIW8_9PSED|nr:threonine ammonia-lyase, biosynthetic [Pseudomonas extremaustralis]EZI28537.1 threonine dehydratase [Pseudomonas extremaustralis 14-3 substr. 14-3b]MDF3134828.1 threonine ammonia-lyase, biosynthetic [Pseudomonas extremaustralis]MDG2966547.1 threonine ammonia-lyase, biosynthetic [Pseudomonas extremaustralis]TWS05284.1 threonine ammonia-lyase, biosynthetic [Pseudomonas extremaustralis]UUJ38312.1 threonine ammonia-lyase, biosynthetic [Pseudomonas extremaustralis]